jgi:hypothetical protein
MNDRYAELAADEWVTFPGGQLEGRRPRSLCAACREALKRAALANGNRAADGELPRRRTLCFQCYRADLERDRALKAAGDLNTTSAERFQCQLPLEAVDAARLARLKSQRAQSRAGTPHYEAARRRAQIESRHALQQIASGLRDRALSATDRHQAIFEAVHAAELQLPEAWLPFVVAH